MGCDCGCGDDNPEPGDFICPGCKRLQDVKDDIEGQLICCNPKCEFSIQGINASNNNGDDDVD